MAPPNAGEKAECRRVAGEQDMGAVVDAHPALRVVIGPAAPAGLVGCLVHNGRDAASRELDRCGQSGKTAADDMNCFRHQMRA